MPSYPPDAIFYTRAARTVVEKPFFSKNWYVGIALMVVAVALIYMFLAIWVCLHFRRPEQNRAKRIVAASYTNSGFYEMSNVNAGTCFDEGQLSGSQQINPLAGN